MAIVTLADVKEFINNPDADDDLVEALIDRASADIEIYTMQPIEPRDIVENKDGGFTDFVLVHRPIITVNNIQDFADPDNPETVDPTTFTVYEKEGRIVNGARGRRTRSKWTKGIQRWQIDYKAGFDPIPEDVKQATIFLVSSWYNNRNSGDFQSESLGDYSYTVNSIASELGIPSTVKRMLAPYRETVF